MKLNLHINGIDHEIDARPGDSLLKTLRGIGIFGVKFGDEHGISGVDTVLMDGKPINADLGGGGCIRAIIPTIKTQKCLITLPCGGFYRFALIPEDKLRALELNNSVAPAKGIKYGTQVYNL